MAHNPCVRIIASLALAWNAGYLPMLEYVHLASCPCAAHLDDIDKAAAGHPTIHEP